MSAGWEEPDVTETEAWLLFGIDKEGPTLEVGVTASLPNDENERVCELASGMLIEKLELGGILDKLLDGTEESDTPDRVAVVSVWMLMKPVSELELTVESKDCEARDGRTDELDRTLERDTVLDDELDENVLLHVLFVELDVMLEKEGAEPNVELVGSCGGAGGDDPSESEAECIELDPVVGGFDGGLLVLGLREKDDTKLEIAPLEADKVGNDEDAKDTDKDGPRDPEGDANTELGVVETMLRDVVSGLELNNESLKMEENTGLGTVTKLLVIVRENQGALLGVVKEFERVAMEDVKLVDDPDCSEGTENMDFTVVMSSEVIRVNVVVIAEVAL